MFFVILGSKMGSLSVGRCLKSFLEVLRFVVTEYRAVGSHGDPIRDRNCSFRPKLLQHVVTPAPVVSWLWSIRKHLEASGASGKASESI